MSNQTTLALAKHLQEQINGLRSDPSQRGPAGENGTDGKPGAKGAKGDQGTRGEAGADGDRGPAGSKGEDGESAPVITQAEFDFDNSLAFTFSDGTVVQTNTLTLPEREVGEVKIHGGGGGGYQSLLDRIEELEEGMAQASYGEQVVINSTPMAQINAVYGIGDQADVFEGLGGTVADGNAMFACTTGTDPAGFAGVLSKRSVSYRPGQGMMCRFSAIFGTPTADNRQQAGFTSATDALMFGYDGTTFGIVREYGGFIEVQTLTLTTPASGSENATVTVDGVAYTVPLTSGTLAHNAMEIADSLNAQAALWRVTANGDTVVAVSFFARPAGAFAFSSGTAAGTWVQTTAGVTPGREHIPQSQWNQDTMDRLDPELGNVYQIQMQWLGFGNVFFYVEDPDTGRYKLVHIYKYANSAVTPSLANPILKVGWFNGNVGSTTGSTLTGASAAGFIEGEIVWHGDPHAATASNPSTTTTEENLITLRSRWEYQGIANRIETELEDLNVSTDAAKITHFSLYKNATLTGDCTWDYVDQQDSVIECCKDALLVSGGKLIGTFSIAGGGSEIIDLTNITPHLEPGETYTVTSHVLSGASAAVEVDLTWKELK